MSRFTLFERLEEKGQQGVAEELGYGQSSMSRVELGQQLVSLRLDGRCARVWGDSYDSVATLIESKRRYAKRQRCEASAESDAA